MHRLGCPMNNSPYAHCECASIDLREHTHQLERFNESAPMREENECLCAELAEALKSCAYEKQRADQEEIAAARYAKMIFDLREKLEVARNVLDWYADKSHWDNNTTASSGGDEECKIFLSTECMFFDNEPGWTKAAAALVAMSTP